MAKPSLHRGRSARRCEGGGVALFVDRAGANRAARLRKRMGLNRTGALARANGLGHDAERKKETGFEADAAH